MKKLIGRSCPNIFVNDNDKLQGGFTVTSKECPSPLDTPIACLDTELEGGRFCTHCANTRYLGNNETLIECSCKE